MSSRGILHFPMFISSGQRASGKKNFAYMPCHARPGHDLENKTAWIGGSE